MVTCRLNYFQLAVPDVTIKFDLSAGPIIRKAKKKPHGFVESKRNFVKKNNRILAKTELVRLL